MFISMNCKRDDHGKDCLSPIGWCLDGIYYFVLIYIYRLVIICFYRYPLLRLWFWS
jgi:hypothetical protein